MTKKPRPRQVKLWQVVEVFPDGTRFRRTSGSLAFCNYVAAQMIDVGFRAVVEPYKDQPKSEEL